MVKGDRVFANDITEDQIIDVAADFLEPIIGDCYSAQVNRIPTAKGAFSILTPLRYIRISTTSSKKALLNPQQYVGGATGFNTFNNGVFFSEFNAEGLTEVRQMDMQVDIYGEGAANRAIALETLWRSDYAYQGLKSIDQRVAPIYCSEVTKSPFVDESSQWLERYIITLSMQVHITINVPQDYFNRVDFTTEKVTK